MMSLGLNIILFGGRQQLILQKEKAVASRGDDNRSFNSCFSWEKRTPRDVNIAVSLSIWGRSLIHGLPDN